ncbi:MAG: ROK family protein [Candidatus Brocadiae bacterium]|nr:ROK family protein [Candidatus Brocadiia bacterium]
MRYTILGLDGGATKIRGAILARTSDHDFFCDGTTEEILYRDCEGYQAGFQSVPILLQLEQMRQNNIVLSQEEETQGKAFIQAAFLVIERLYQRCEGNPCLIGVGMPGLKTSDARGIVAMANGPRIPGYAESLEFMLKQKNINLASPIARLGSDADYCGFGEMYSKEGKMKEGSNVYYLGIGTGVADAMKIQGELLPFDKAKGWIAKSWEMLGKEGKTFEKKISMSAIEEEYRQKSQGKSLHAGEIFQLASQKDPLAKGIIESVVAHLSHLIYDRIHTLALGGTTAQFADAKRISLQPNHPFISSHWDKIVLGQRMGHLWAKEEYQEFFQNAVYTALEQKILSLPEPFRSFYLEGENGRKNFLVASPLDIAPVLGAGICAYFMAKETVS